MRQCRDRQLDVKEVNICAHACAAWGAPQRRLDCRRISRRIECRLEGTTILKILAILPVASFGTQYHPPIVLCAGEGASNQAHLEPTFLPSIANLKNGVVPRCRKRWHRMRELRGALVPGRSRVNRVHNRKKKDVARCMYKPASVGESNRTLARPARVKIKRIFHSDSKSTSLSSYNLNGSKTHTSKY